MTGTIRNHLQSCHRNEYVAGVKALRLKGYEAIDDEMDLSDTGASSRVGPIRRYDPDKHEESVRGMHAHVVRWGVVTDQVSIHSHVERQENNALIRTYDSRCRSQTALSFVT